MARVHGLQHVQGLAGADLAQDDAVGAHAQGVPDQVPLGDLASPLQVGGARFQADHMGLLELQFGGVLDGDDPLAVVDHARQGVEQGRLARARTAGNQDVEAHPRGDLQHHGHLRRQVPLVLHDFQGDLLLGEFPDRDGGAVQGQRRNDDVDARPVIKPGVHQWRRLVHPPADPRHDAGGDVHDMGVVAEGDVGQLHLAGALHVDLLGAVDQDVGDLFPGQKRLERAQAEHVVEQHGDQVPLLEQVEVNLLLAQDLGDDLTEPADQLAARQLGGLGDVDALHEHRLDAFLGRLDAVAAGGNGVAVGVRHRIGRHLEVGNRAFRRKQEFVDQCGDHVPLFVLLQEEFIVGDLVHGLADHLGQIGARHPQQLFRIDLFGDQRLRPIHDRLHDVITGWCGSRRRSVR